MLFKDFFFMLTSFCFQQRDEEFHKAMLEDSLSYMSDEEKNKILAKLKSKGITDIKVPEDK